MCIVIHSQLGRLKMNPQTCINNFILQKDLLPMPSIDSRRDIICSHLDAIYNFYGEKTGPRVAKKHLSWYCEYLPEAEDFRFRFVRTNNSSQQMQLTNNFFLRCLN